MKKTSLLIRMRVGVVLLAAFLLAASTSHALDLAAVEAEWTPPDSAVPITMWGFIPDPGSCPASPVSWDVGPVIIESPGNSLTINLRNCLSEEVSMIIPGQRMPVGSAPVWTDGSSGPRTDLTQRVRSFTNEAPVGGTATYTWNFLKAGTYLYQSGTHPSKQVQMGLYGALKIGTYHGTRAETMILFSEIDPALHDPTPTAATPLTYKPKYYLINGDTFSAGQPVPVAIDNLIAGKHLLVRFLNAGLMTHIPVLHGSHMQILAEDGNRYSYPQKRYSMLLAAGKTFDVFWTPTETGTYALYDRRLSLTSNGAPGGGMMVYLDVAVPAFPWVMFVPAITAN